MSAGGALSERVLVLAPGGRDALIGQSMLTEGGFAAKICAHLDDLCDGLSAGAGAAVAVEEVFYNADLNRLTEWIEAQPSWSDLPFVLLTWKGGGVERNPRAQRLSAVLGNVTFLERPFHPTTLISVVSTALRSRRRQYDARERLEEIRRGEALLEQRVHDRTAELEATNRQLAAQIQERERVESALRQSQRLEAIGQLTSGVAHDFNNLLTVLLGNVRQIQKATTDPALLRRLNMMAEAGARGARLTSQMLAFSRRQKLQPRAVDLNETVSNMRDLLQSTMGGRVQLETRLAEGLWPAMIDPTQIELVILNLAINARDAMEVGGSLGVCTENVTLGPPRRPEEPPAGEYVMVAVSDTGCGMTADVLEKAFEPFFTTKDIGKGSGLGLSQVFGLAKQSGGGVAVDTKVGRGTTIKVYLPRAAAARPESVQPVEVRSIRGDGRLVLLVDDDEAVREVTGGMLRELGYGVVEAASGGAALQALEDQPDVQLALLDYAMPGMNGAEVAREIRSRRPELPILFATGYADTSLLVEAGDDGVLSKPFALSELAAKVSAAVTSTAHAEAL